MPEPTYRIAQRLHERRAAKGMETYGLHLGPFNGRSSIIDAIEESADMLVYLLNIAQESRHLLMDLMINSVRLREAGQTDAADGLDKIIVGMGGKKALAQYDEILGTVAENATVDPRAMVAEGIAELRASLPTDATNEAKPEMREYRFDRYVNGKLKAEGAALVAANDQEAAEKLTKLCCDHPVILIGFAVQPTTDPRDEALRVATEALNEVVCWIPDGTRKSPLERGAKVETVHDLMQMITAAIRAAGGAR